MNIEALIGTFVRQFNQRLFDVPTSREYVDLPAPAPGKPYLLYLHIPFCRALCPFCNFHRVRFDEEAAASYFDCLETEIRRVSDRGYRFDELYVGGGTPTVMPGRLLGLIRRLRQEHGLTAASIETNPNQLDRKQLEEFAAAGVSRLSVGVQSFDDVLLERMHRKQAYGDSEQIVGNLRRAAGVFKTLNVDMIFNLPGQSVSSLARDLDLLLDDLAVDQVSWYPLMTTSGNRSAIRASLGEADFTRERRMYEQIARRMAEAGYTRNSAWCFSRQRGMVDEYIVNREEYVGLGAGAFSYLGGSLYSGTFSNDEYRSLVADGRTGTVLEKRLDAKEQMRYYLLVTLFSGSLDLSRAERRFGHRFRQTLAPEIAGLKLLGAVQESAGHIALTERGHYLWVVLMREFFGGINRLRENMRYMRVAPSRVARAGE